MTSKLLPPHMHFWNITRFCAWDRLVYIKSQIKPFLKCIFLSIPMAARPSPLQDPRLGEALGIPTGRCGVGRAEPARPIPPTSPLNAKIAERAEPVSPIPASIESSRTANRTACVRTEDENSTFKGSRENREISRRNYSRINTYSNIKKSLQVRSEIINSD